jgi:hypothetical protein
MSGDQNAGQSHNMKTDNRSFGKVEEFKYLGTILFFGPCILNDKTNKMEKLIFGLIIVVRSLQHVSAP